jgi:hypothetical protein
MFYNFFSSFYQLNHSNENIKLWTKLHAALKKVVFDVLWYFGRIESKIYMALKKPARPHLFEPGLVGQWLVEADWTKRRTCGLVREPYAILKDTGPFPNFHSQISIENKAGLVVSCKHKEKARYGIWLIKQPSRAHLSGKITLNPYH